MARGDVSLVHLKGPWGPKNAAFHRGFVIVIEDGKFVQVTDREDGGGTCDLYPVENVSRVEWNTGWGNA